MLGNKTLEILVFFLIGTFLFGWLVLLFFILLEKIFPKYESRLESFLQGYGNVFGHIQKVIFVIVILLLAIKVISGWMGWDE